MTKMEAFLGILRSTCQFFAFLGALLSLYAFVKTSEEIYAVVMLQLITLYELWRRE